MIDHEPVIRAYFEKLGLEPEVADLYFALYLRGPQTISELARASGVERTRIYRLMEHLRNSGLVEVEVRYKSSLFRAAPISNVRLLVSRKEQELKGLQVELPVVEAALERNSLVSPATRVQFYHGPDGVKQMFWNQTKANSEVLSILYENMQIRTQSVFFERWVRRCNERGMELRSIIGDAFVKSQHSWYAVHDNERLEKWQARYVPESLFTITHGLLLYDDVVGYLNWKDEEVFGVEIHNPDIARSQRRFFELLWDQAQAMPDLA
jgi:sugar-specific transcriptional regulator TrmB